MCTRGSACAYYCAIRDLVATLITADTQLGSVTDRSQPAMWWSVSATRSGAENIAQ